MYQLSLSSASTELFPLLRRPRKRYIVFSSDIRAACSKSRNLGSDSHLCRFAMRDGICDGLYSMSKIPV
jgi:hypothetical protein